jgi:hypothetical protein
VDRFFTEDYPPANNTSAASVCVKKSWTHSSYLPSLTMATGQSAGVRFAAENQEIAPDHTLEDIQMSNDRHRDDINPATEQELAQLKTTLQNNIQNSRMQHHAFEPVSLPGSMPASRVRKLSHLILNL